MEESPSLMSVCINFLFTCIDHMFDFKKVYNSTLTHCSTLFRLDGSIEYSFEKILITWLGREVRKRYLFLI